MIACRVCFVTGRHVEDACARRVPRAWIAVGCMAQIIVNIIYARPSMRCSLAPVILLLRHARRRPAVRTRPGSDPGHFGFGDVTVVGHGIGRRHVRPVPWCAVVAVHRHRPAVDAF